MILGRGQGTKDFFLRITGAVTGTLGAAETIEVLIFIIAIVGIYIYVAVMRRRQTSG